MSNGDPHGFRCRPRYDKGIQLRPYKVSYRLNVSSREEVLIGRISLGEPQRSHSSRAKGDPVVGDARTELSTTEYLAAMTTFKPLCSRCKQINFDALRGPSATDLEHLAAGNGTGERFAQVLPGTNHDKVNLGTLSRIRSDSSNCPLCALFYHIINRQGAVYWHRLAYETLDSGDIEFRADPDLSYYARIIGLDTASQTSFVFRRLNLTAHTATSPDNAIAYFDNVLQVCDVGALSARIKQSATQAHRRAERMPFGGRKRPLTSDLQLVHVWMRICADEHGTLCILDQAQVDSSQ